MKSEQWKQMGWQGTDPSTDFRGAGYVALEQLLYLARQHPALFRRLLTKTDDDRVSQHYPFSVAGLNLTYMLLRALDLAAPAPAAAASAASGTRVPASPSGRGFLALLDREPASFDEIYCAAFELLDQRWWATKATYMQFNAVLADVRKALEAALASGPSSISALRALMGLPVHFGHTAL